MVVVVVVVVVVGGGGTRLAQDGRATVDRVRALLSECSPPPHTHTHSPSRDLASCALRAMCQRAVFGAGRPLQVVQFGVRAKHRNL